MPYKERSIEEMVEVYKTWVETHPQKYYASVESGGGYSPRRILDEMREDTDFAKIYINAQKRLAKMYEVDPLEKVMEEIAKNKARKVGRFHPIENFIGEGMYRIKKFLQKGQRTKDY